MSRYPQRSCSRHAILSQGRRRSRLNISTIICVRGDILLLAVSMVRPGAQLAAENLFLCKQLALYVERQVRRGESLTQPADARCPVSRD